MSNHVSSWQKAKGNTTRENALLDQWFGQQWQVVAFGLTWEGTLSEIQPTPDVFFTIEIPDPGHANTTLRVTAPFEQFRPASREVK